MAEFKAFAPRVEVLGEVLNAFIGGFPSEVLGIGKMVLERHGIKDPHPGDFYPLQSLLDSMKDVSDKYSGQMLFRIGFQIAGNAKLPPGIDSIEKALELIDTAYHMNHRGGEIGHYLYTSTGFDGLLNRGKMLCHNPYPCFFDLGVIEGFAKRFKPADCRDVLVRHDESQPCRRQGGDSCTYIVSWG
jgi:hypothetical protein